MNKSKYTYKITKIISNFSSSRNLLIYQNQERNLITYDDLVNEQNQF